MRPGGLYAPTNPRGTHTHLVGLAATGDEISVDGQPHEVALVRVPLERPRQGAPGGHGTAPAPPLVAVHVMDLHGVQGVEGVVLHVMR